MNKKEMVLKQKRKEEQERKEGDTILINKVQKALDKIRPYLQADGGDAVIKEITKEKIVIIELLGACKQCKFSSSTFKAGIEQVIISHIPEIIGIKEFDRN